LHVNALITLEVCFQKYLMNDTGKAMTLISGDPLITIAIPTYNRARQVAACVASALAQKYRNIEVLVSDNASADNTQAALGDIKDSRLRVIRQERNIGLLPNWNACLQEARGDYFILLPDDDRLTPLMVESCVELVRGEPGLPIVITLSDIDFAEEHRREPASKSARLSTGIWDGNDILLEHLGHRISVRMCSVVMQTAAARAQGGFSSDLPYAADMACWIPLLMAGKAGFVNEGCGVFTVHNSSETAGQAFETQLKDMKKLTQLTIDTAERSVNHFGMRRKIQSEAQLYLALWPIYHDLVPDARLMDVLKVIWRWRRSLLDAGIVNAAQLAKIVLHLITPAPVVGSIRRLLTPFRRARTALN
jgi:glycosyltransferase involved in cell wall biosynthesis